MGGRSVLDQDLRTLYQPIVDLREQRAVVAVEALTRGRPGGLELPERLFAVAAQEGVLPQLDERCLRLALSGAAATPEPSTVFVNVEPVTLARMTAGELEAVAASVPAHLHVVLEVTERDLMTDPAGLVRAVQGAHDLGWGIALDDVGAEPAGVALLSFLRPDVIKLDLALIHGRTTLQLATIVNAVRAEAERTGCLVLAEGIETEAHLERALATGAQLGQGWLFGRPGAMPAAGTSPLARSTVRHPPWVSSGTPYGVLSDVLSPQRSTGPLLEALTHQLEHQALALDNQTIVMASFERLSQVGAATRRRYASLAAVTAMTVMVAPGLEPEPVPGARGVSVEADDVLNLEWNVMVIAPHFAAALTARAVESPSGTPMSDVPTRTLEYVLTYDRDVVVQAAHTLLAKVQPSSGSLARRLRPDPPETTAAGTEGTVVVADLPGALLRAVRTSTLALALADATRPDLPLVYVNDAFSALTGYPEEEVVGRNCRFLQGTGTDRERSLQLSEQLEQGRGAHTVLLNYRRDGSAFWNDVQISPVLDDAGDVTHFLASQRDVTARLEREHRTAYMAYHDALTTLPNRANVLGHLASQLQASAADGSAVAVIVIDLDGFKAINDRLGHSAGDVVLRTAGQRLRSSVRAGDLVGRLGGDEFLVVLAGLPGGCDAGVVDALLRHLRVRLDQPVTVDDELVPLRSSMGAAVYPVDGVDADGLIASADQAMYRDKAAAAPASAADTHTTAAALRAMAQRATGMAGVAAPPAAAAAPALPEQAPSPPRPGPRAP